MKPLLLIVGESASKQDPDGVLSLGSQSGRRFAQWLQILDPEGHYETSYINALKDGKVQRRELEQACKGADAVVTLGSVAADKLTDITPHFWMLPHPSGLNRLLNDPLYVEYKLSGVAFLLKKRYTVYQEAVRQYGHLFP